MLPVWHRRTPSHLLSSTPPCSSERVDSAIEQAQAHRAAPGPGGAQPGARALAAQAGLDGCRNVWILKPGGLSRGRGISLVTSLAQVGAVAALGALRGYVDSCVTPCVAQDRPADQCDQSDSLGGLVFHTRPARVAQAPAAAAARHSTLARHVTRRATEGQGTPV